MIRRLTSLIFAAVLLNPISSQAQDYQYKQLEPGQTIVSLSAMEQMNLQQDLLQGSLRIEIDGKNPKEVQDKINSAMQSAIDMSAEFKDVKTSTGQYYVYSYDPNPQPGSSTKSKLTWKGSQTIDISSKNSAKLLDLAGKIQEQGFVMNGLNYTLSPEQSEAYKDTLMVAALKKISARAELAAKALNKGGYEIIEVNVDNAGPIPPMPVMMKGARMDMASMEASMSAPVAQAGEQTVTMNVMARVLLKP